MHLSTSLNGIYRVKEGDVVVLESQSGARGVPPNYYVLLVDRDRMTELTSPDFSSEDFTFEVTQKGDEIYFNLGFDKKWKKRAIYRNGVLSVFFEKRITLLPKEECANVLNMAAKCVTLPRCDDDMPFAASGLRYFAMLEQNMPVFKASRFLEVCANICATKSYDAVQSRKVLCGY
jgi:hypothetical protein